MPVEGASVDIVKQLPGSARCIAVPYCELIGDGFKINIVRGQAIIIRTPGVQIHIAIRMVAMGNSDMPGIDIVNNRLIFRFGSRVRTAVSGT